MVIPLDFSSCMDPKQPIGLSCSQRRGWLIKIRTFEFTDGALAFQPAAALKAIYVTDFCVRIRSVNRPRANIAGCPESVCSYQVIPSSPGQTGPEKYFLCNAERSGQRAAPGVSWRCQYAAHPEGIPPALPAVRQILCCPRWVHRLGKYVSIKVDLPAPSSPTIA